MAFDKKKFIARFIQEAREHIEQFNDGVLNLEKNPDDTESLNTIFRSAHTIKGSSRMMKLLGISQLAHKLEDVLDAWRKGKLDYSRALSDILFEGADTISGMLDDVEAGEETDEAPEDICERLEKAAQGLPYEKSGAVRKQKQPPPKAEKKDLTPTEKPEEKAPEEKKQAPPKEETAELPPQKQKAEKPEEDSSPKSEPKAAKADKESTAPASPDIQLQADEGEDEKPLVAKVGKTIRINTNKLDEVVKLMGEILSAHSMTRQHLSRFKKVEELSLRTMNMIVTAGKQSASLSAARHKEIYRLVNELNREVREYGAQSRESLRIHELLATDLQDKSVRLRMVPLSTIFSSLPRTTRDIARSCNKEVDLIVSGEDTEMDKDIIEKLGDPLVHMIRNSIDHGIESPEDRLRSGKPTYGTLRLSAIYEGGNVLLRFSDDGRGIAIPRIREKAVRHKIITEQEAGKISEREIVNLIFHPGLSTSEMITDISGRGVAWMWSGRTLWMISKAQSG